MHQILSYGHTDVDREKKSYNCNNVDFTRHQHDCVGRGQKAGTGGCMLERKLTVGHRCENILIIQVLSPPLNGLRDHNKMLQYIFDSCL